MTRYIKEPLRNLISVLLRDSAGIQLLLIMCGSLLGFGFLLGGSTNTNYDAISNLMPFRVWGYLYLTYAFIKAYDLLYNQISVWLSMLISAYGIWAWNYIFLSFTLFDPLPMAPTELLLFIPVLAEVWHLTSIIYAKDFSKGSKQ